MAVWCLRFELSILSGAARFPCQLAALALSCGGRSWCCGICHDNARSKVSLKVRKGSLFPHVAWVEKGNMFNQISFVLRNETRSKTLYCIKHIRINWHINQVNKQKQNRDILFITQIFKFGKMFQNLAFEWLAWSTQRCLQCFCHSRMPREQAPGRAGGDNW